MTRIDGLLATGLFVGVLLLGGAGYALGGGWLEPSVTAVLLALAVAAVALVTVQLASHRVLKKRLDHLARRNGDLQTLLGLYQMLPFRSPLPLVDAWSAAPDFLALVAEIVRERRPSCVVECGSGTSTLVTAYALQENGAGRIVSLDHEEAFSKRTQDLLRRHHLTSVAEVRHAPLTLGASGSPWYRSSEWDDLSDIDLLVVDGPPTVEDADARYPALPALYDRLAPGAHVVVDDADRSGERAMVRRWREQFPNLDVTYLQTAKGTYVIRKPDSA